ncbi:MAG TPA: hypothetical protein VKB93_20000 [Thermoanaerobaculia bacterium]|nr:hypothetical protein [Thermoanaerobaculia bacterium]
MSGFDELWRSAVRYRHASRELQPLLHAVYDDLGGGELAALRASLENLLVFLAAPEGRTDANCSTVHHFFNETESLWRPLREDFRDLCDDMSGTLHDAIYAPDIARTFEALPEQLLERVRRIDT